MSSRSRQLLTGIWIGVFLAAMAGACAARDPRLRDLGARLDCLRERNLAVVAAHRGQPDASAAENSMSSLRASLAAGVAFLEVDIASTRDGVLVLMHDRTLDRTTTGSGPVSGRSWAEVRRLRLKRPDGAVLDEGVPRLADVLDWGRKAGAHFELDIKETTNAGDVVDAVRGARVEQRVVVITYSLAGAKAIHDLDPRLMMTVTIEQPGDLEAARRLLPADRLLAFTGLRDPGPAALAALRSAGIEPILGTLGTPGERLDDVYLADGDPSEYAELVRSGVVMIASDRAVTAQRSIGFEYRACLQAR